jgi:hypothetical protein
MPEPVSPTGTTLNEISIVRSTASMDRATRLRGERCTQVDKKMSESVGKFQNTSDCSNKRSRARHAGRAHGRLREAAKSGLWAALGRLRS